MTGAEREAHLQRIADDAGISLERARCLVVCREERHLAALEAALEHQRHHPEPIAFVQPLARRRTDRTTAELRAERLAARPRRVAS